MKPKISYINVGRSTFVLKDIHILEKYFEVEIFDFCVKSKLKLFLEFLREFYFLIKNHRNQITIIQFAGYHSFIPVILKYFTKSKVVIVLGGTDTVSFPSIKYGGFQNKLMLPFLRSSIKRANLLLPVSETLIETEYTYQQDDFPKQGYSFFIKNVKTPVKTIYNGFEAEKWIIGEKESNTFITTAADLNTRFGVKLKGIDLILEIAPFFPNCKFFIVGGNVLKDVPVNVIKIGNVNSDELASILSTKEFYLQLSISEGFPNGLCEAMLSGCIPIVSNVGAMPKIVENVGYILKNKSLNKLKNLIESILSRENKRNIELVRERILTEYPLERREEELISTLRNSLKRH